MDKIVIVKLSSLGDIIHTLPAFKLLRENFPSSEVIWIVEESGREILEMVDGIDKIYTIDTKELRRGKKVVKNISKIRKLKRIKADILFDFQGTMKSAVVTSLINSKRKVGFSKKNLKEKTSLFFYKETVSYFEETEHVIRKNIHLLSSLNIYASTFSFPSFKYTKKLKNDVKEKMKEIDMGKVIILNVGGGWETKRLDVKKWIDIAKGIVYRNFIPLILWGNDFEKKDAAKVALESGALLSPPFTLKELFPLIQDSLLLVSGDTLPLHIAEAVKTPTVSFFGPTLPSRNGPVNPISEVILYELKCSGCFKRKCSNPICMNRIKSTDILKKVDLILSKIQK